MTTWSTRTVTEPVRRSRVAALFGLMLLVDLAFVAGNATKVDDGGWVPLVLAALSESGRSGFTSI